MKLTTISVRFSVLSMLAMVAMGCGDPEDGEDFDGEEDMVTESADAVKGGGKPGGGGVVTNYGQGYLTDGTYVTFTKNMTTGVITAQSPASIKGKTLIRNANGTYSVVN